MSQPFVGQITIMSFNFPPSGWATCNGQFLPINQNQALFSLLGTFYGGNGQTTFALPNLRGRVALGSGANYTNGSAAGSERVTLNINQMPAHVHDLRVDAVSDPGNSVASPTNAFLGRGVAVQSVGGNAPLNVYATGTPDATLDLSTVATVGASQPHENMQPYVVLNFCIALQGVFPSRN